MGPEMLIPLAISAAGTVAQMSAADEQRSDRRNIMNQQLERDGQATNKAIKLVQDEGQQYGLEDRLAALKKQEDQTYGQIESDIQGAGGSQISTAAGAGDVSEDFIKGRAERAVTEGTRLTSIAREAAKTRAPGQLMSEDALRRAGMAGELQNTWSSNSNMSRATGQDAEGVEMPAYGQLGSIASALGAGFAGSEAAKGLGTRIKYAGTSINPSAANYTNSMDSGIRW